MKKKLRLLSIFVIFSIILLTINNVYAEVRYNNDCNNDYNIHGIVGGEDIKTTFGDSGFSTIFRVNGSATEHTVTRGSGSGDGVTCTTTGTPISNGNYIKVNFKLKNNNSSPVTVSLASHSDIQIGDNDQAPITKISNNRGFTMTDGSGHTFTFLCRKSYGVVDVSSFWFGHYSDRDDHYWDTNDVNLDSLTSTDSGMTFCWLNKPIPANGEINLSVLFGVGERNGLPTLTIENAFKENYFFNEEIYFYGKIGDIDKEDSVKIFYAIDNEKEVELNEAYTPNGEEIEYQAKLKIPASTTIGEHIIQIWVQDNNGNMSVPIKVHFKIIEAMVTLVFYQENPNNDDYTMIGTYSVSNVNVGDKVSDIDDIDNIIINQFNNIKKEEKDFFKYNDELTASEIDNEIKSNENIVNIYFDRKEYTIKFIPANKVVEDNQVKYKIATQTQNNKDISKWEEIDNNIKIHINDKDYDEYVIKAKYEQYIEWPKDFIISDRDNQEYTFCGWNTNKQSNYYKNYENANILTSYDSMSKELILDAKDTEKEHIMYALWSKSPIYYEFHFCYEYLDTEKQDECVEYNNKYYYEEKTEITNYNNLTSKITLPNKRGYNIAGNKVSIEDTSTGTTSEKPIKVYIYYDRKKYRLVLNNCFTQYVPSKLPIEYERNWIFLDEENENLIVKYGFDFTKLDDLTEIWLNDKENKLRYLYSLKNNEYAEFYSWYNSIDLTNEFKTDDINLFDNYNDEINLYAGWTTFIIY